MADDSDPSDPKTWELATRMVRGGMARSQFGETSEAIFLTQGYVYDSAEGADEGSGGKTGDKLRTAAGRDAAAETHSVPSWRR